MKQLLSETTAIYIGSDVLKKLDKFIDKNYNSSNKFLLVDENTYKNCLPLIKRLQHLSNNIIIQIKSGEKNKNLITINKIWEELTLRNADRKSLLISLGGGVISDLGGFAASTFKRGIDFINLPTTLLSQVDASIGGKTGIDFYFRDKILKNQIGLFNNPKAVFIFPTFLKTLNKREILSGFAEVIKHALIKDKHYWQKIKKIHSPTDLLINGAFWEKIIIRSIEIKNDIVSKDPHETNLRKILNFGHTIGHAIESFSLQKDKKALLHGEAIAIGMISEAYISNKITGLKKKELDDISSFIGKTFLPYKIDTEFFPDIMALIKRDKKNENAMINFSLLSKIGHCVINQNCSDLLILESLHFYNSLFPNFKQ